MKTVKALLKRLDVLSVKVPSNIPAIVFIEQQGDEYLVTEHYHRGKHRVRYKPFTINDPVKYEAKGGVIFHGEWDLE